MSAPDSIAAAIKLIADLPPDSDLPTEDLQVALAALIRIYGHRSDTDKSIMPVAGPNSVTATDVMLTVTALMRSVNVQFIELGIWQNMTARH